MKDKQSALAALKENFQKMAAAKELYDKLKVEYPAAISVGDLDVSIRLEGQLLYAKERVLKLTMKNKEILNFLKSCEGK